MLSGTDPFTVTVSATEFAPGDEVTLKSDPGKAGYVVQVVPSAPENRYAVIDGKKLTCYASQLERKIQPLEQAASTSWGTANAIFVR